MAETNPNRVVGENDDLQFDSTGETFNDLIALGADTLLEKTREEAQPKIAQFVETTQNCYGEDPFTTGQVIRYFRDRRRGLGLKEQPALAIACLHEHIAAEEVLDILQVQPQGEEGAVSPRRTDFADLTRIVGWHHFLYGRDAKLGQGVLDAMYEAIQNRDDVISHILRYKSVGSTYTKEGNVQVGIIDILGILKARIQSEMPELWREYSDYLYPRFRQHKYGARPTSEVGEKQRQYFAGELDPGVVPPGIRMEQVLARKDVEGLKTIVGDGRVSDYQLKINLGGIARQLGGQAVSALSDRLADLRLWPHEILAMAKAFKAGTKHTPASPHCLAATDELLRHTVERYANDANRKVLFLGDTSGSMWFPISERSTIQANEFATFMSYFGSMIGGLPYWGEWGSDAYMYDTPSSPDTGEFLDHHYRGDCGTDVVNAVRTAVDHFKVRPPEEHPDVICLISDMQFNRVAGGYGGSTAKAAATVEAALDYAEQHLGRRPVLAFWNVSAKSVPSCEDSGVLHLSGFSANAADVLFKAIEDQPADGVARGDVFPDDILDVIRDRYVAFNRLEAVRVEPRGQQESQEPVAQG